MDSREFLNLVTYTKSLRASFILCILNESSLFSFILATYRHLKAGQFLDLPSETTLNAYSQFCSTKAGFDVEKIKQLLVEMKIDEMHIKSGLVYDKGTGQLIGFTDLGDINSEIERFEQQLAGSNERPLATQIICFIVRGIYSHLNYPIGFFGTNGCRSDQIYNCCWEAVRVLEAVGINVRDFISDGASSNRTFYNLHQLPKEDTDNSDDVVTPNADIFIGDANIADTNIADTDIADIANNDITDADIAEDSASSENAENPNKDEDKSNVHKDGTLFWCWNRFNAGNKIYFFCDVPHLVKTARNNLENSHAHLCSRNLTVSDVFKIIQQILL